MSSGNRLVVDTSALLAVYFAESAAPWVAQQFQTYPGTLIMSTVNMAEVMIIVRSRRPSGAGRN